MDAEHRGERFGPYLVQDLIGQGGMGEVHRAFDTRRNREVALKRMNGLLHADAALRERFRAESALAARLTEPHVIPVHDFGEIDGRLFIDMRLVDGTDLAAALRTGPLSAERSVDLVAQVADALDAAHRAGLVHRDVKPSNVLLAGADVAAVRQRGFAYLADFGVAALLGAGTGPPGGSLDHTPPERLLGGPGDARGDVYSLACLLFECLAGRSPYDHADPPRVLFEKIHGTPPRLDALRPDLPGAVHDVLARGLATDPPDPHPGAGDFAADVARAMTGPVPSVVLPVRPASWGTTDAAPTGPTVQMIPAPHVPAPHTPAVAGSAAPGSAPVRTRQSGRTPWLAVVVAGLVGVALATSALVAPMILGDRSIPEQLWSVPVGHEPAEVALSPDGATAWVTNGDDGTVTVIDTAARAVVGPPIPVGDGPNGVAVTPDGRRVVVTNSGSGDLTVLDAARRTVLGRVPIGSYPDGLALSPDGWRAYVTDADETGGRVVVVDLTALRTVGEPIRTGLTPYGLALDPAGERIYVTNFGSDSVSVIEVARIDGTGGGVVATVPTGSKPLGVVVSPDGARVFVATYGGGTVQEIDAATMTVVGAPLPVGRAPLGLALTDDATGLLVANEDSDSLVAIDLADRSVRYQVAAGYGPVHIAVDPGTGTVYVLRKRAADLGVFGDPDGG